MSNDNDPHSRDQRLGILIAIGVSALGWLLIILAVREVISWF